MRLFYKKIISYIICCALVVFSGVMAPLASGAPELPEADSGGADTVSETLGEAKETGAAAGALPLEVPSAILVETFTGAVLFEKDADTPRPPASITKIMTLLLTFEAIERGELSMEELVPASEYACSMGGSQIWLEPGESMSVNELIKATAVGSANDAAVVLAERVSGSEAEFVARMNQRAKELNMNGTNFINCNGLDEDGHVTTARDISIMSRELLKHPEITEYTTIWIDELRGGETQLVNTNKLVYHYPGTTGLKTGGTDKAGLCLAASVSRAGLDLVSVVLGAGSSDMQFGDSRKLLDWGFSGFVAAKLPDIDSELPMLPVKKGVLEECQIISSPPERLIVQRGQEERLELSYDILEELQAPVEEGQEVGRVTVTADGKELCTFPVKAAVAVDKINFLRALGILSRNMVSM